MLSFSASNIFLTGRSEAAKNSIEKQERFADFENKNYKEWQQRSKI